MTLPDALEVAGAVVFAAGLAMLALWAAVLFVGVALMLKGAELERRR